MSAIAASLVASSLDVIVVFTSSTLVANEISVLVKTVTFVVGNVYNLCKKQWTSVNVEFLDGKDTPVVLFKTKR